MGTLSPLATRIELCGGLLLEVAARRLDAQLPGRQGRLLLGYLATHRHRAVSRDELAAALWPHSAPRDSAGALRALLSKVRTAIDPVKLEGGASLSLSFPDGVWIDAEAAEDALDSAEAALAASRWAQAREAAGESARILERPFLPEVAAEWVDARGAELEELRLRALECLAKAELRLGGAGLRRAEQAARGLIELAPYRESGYRLLMEALAAGGEAAEALRVYERLRLLLRDELGTTPNRPVQEIHARLLRAEQAWTREGAHRADALPPLPTPTTSLIGRASELARACDLLVGGGVRLLTLTGPGGVGKTRLALAVAVEHGEATGHRAAFVSLESIEDPALVGGAIGRALGLPPGEDDKLTEQLARSLEGRSVLLVVDSFERVGAAAPQLTRLLAGCPGLKLLVTSRAPLRVAGERELPIAPLELPDLRRRSEPAALASVPAVALFVERAHAVDPGFEIDEANAAAVAEICIRLDGLPLAIELTAARTRLLSPDAILERLEHRLELVGEGARDVPARHRTLAEAIAWSYELLDEPERRLLRRLAVFAHGWSVEAAEAVAGTAEAVPRPLDALSSLLSQNLVRRAGDRLSMLETVRAFALERLAASGEMELVRRSHADFFIRMAQVPQPEPRDFENFRAALRFALEHGSRERASRLVEVLSRLGPVRPRPALPDLRWLSRFVGRDAEMAVLEDALEKTLAGDGQVVEIVAGPGVGKSRLAHEFAERCQARELTVHEVQTAAQSVEVPFVFAIALLRVLLGVDERDAEDSARRQMLEATRGFDEEDVALLLGFLGVGDRELPAPELGAEARQRRLLGAVERLVRTRGGQEPLILWLEDLHWLDPASEPFAAAVARAASGGRTLLVSTSRPQVRATWAAEAHCRRLELAPLPPDEMGELLSHLLGTDPSLEALQAPIRARAEGNPFFAEELVESLAEAGTLIGRRGAYQLASPLAATALPPTVEEALATRIQRLPKRDRAVLEAASVIGMEFTAPLLGSVATTPETELTSSLRVLVAADLLRPAALHPDRGYAFKHPLTQHAAYESLPREERGRLHARTAQALAGAAPQGLDELAAPIAQHWERASERLEAGRWFRRAAEWAGNNDPTHAARHWQKVRALVEPSTDRPETIELAILSRRWALQLGWRLGMDEEEAARVFEEGRLLAEAAGDNAVLSVLMAAYATIELMGGRLEQSTRLANEAARVADRSQSIEARLGTRAQLVYLFFHAGRLSEGIAVCDEAIELTGGDASLRISFDIASALAFFVCWRGLYLYELGHSNEGARELDRGLMVARDEGAIEVLIWLSAWSVRLWAHEANPRPGLERAREAVEFAERSGGAFSRVLSASALGFAHLLCGEDAEAARALERALAISAEGRTGLEFEPWTRACLAEVLLGLGHTEQARVEAQRAVELALQRGARLWEIVAQVALARTLGETQRARTGDAVERALARAEELIAQTGATGEEPAVRLAKAQATAGVKPVDGGSAGSATALG